MVSLLQRLTFPDAGVPAQRKVSKRLRPGVRRLAEAPRSLATVSIRGHRLRSASRRPPLDVCGFAARRFAPNPLMNTYARPAEGARDQDQDQHQKPKPKPKPKPAKHPHTCRSEPARDGGSSINIALPDTPPSRAGSLPQWIDVHLQEIGRLSGRLRGQASLLQKASRAAYGFCFSPLIRPSVSSPSALDLDLPAPFGRLSGGVHPGSGA
jgi:hypothetical protein